MDIYDPLNNFEHVRGVELWDPKDKKSEKTGKQNKKDKIRHPINIKILDVGSFMTNGS